MVNTVAQFIPVKLSLRDIAGDEYIAAVGAASELLNGKKAIETLTESSVEFFPDDMQQQLASLLPRVGQQVLAQPLVASARGATTQQFHAATRIAPAPLSGLGYYRIGEDGRLYLLTKSEHYHAPLGHAFPGYRLIEHAKRLGIPNATHNNTRGHLTRLLEEALVAAAKGIPEDDRAALEAVFEQPRALNRVLNLETGSLVAEAALKMMLARFYTIQDEAPPRYHGRTPVLLVMGNDDGGLHANYHGTTTLTQCLRGMWPELAEALQRAGTLQVVAIRPNSVEDLDAAFRRYEQPPYKIAGFFHEIVMMNYGGRLLSRAFLQHAYALCEAHDVPTVVDEIQSGVWSPELFLFREYGLQPSFVAVGKGFPGGEYPASRLLFTAEMDNLPQFGALVTNGQEELASLAYLITMRWVQANAEPIRRIGDYYETRLREFAARYPERITGITGLRHLAGIAFATLPAAKQFVAQLTQRGFDISAQTYKADCPPVVLTKIPLIADGTVVEHILMAMEAAMQEIGVSVSS